MSIREVEEGLQLQGVDERISYALDVANVESSPSSVSAVVKDEAGWTDVTSTLMPTNSPSVNGSVITLSPLRDGTADHVYRVEVKYTASGNVIENYFRVRFAI